MDVGARPRGWHEHHRIVRWTIVGAVAGLLMTAVGLWSIPAGASLLHGYLILLALVGPMLTLLVVIGFGAHMVEYSRHT